MASITTPDNILRQAITPNTQLKPAAQAISQYAGATRADVAEPPQVNSLMQLGNALSGIQPSLRQTAVTLHQQAEERQMSEGEIKGQELAQKKNVRDLAQAVNEGLLDPGASPAYIFATKANFLKLRAEQGQMQMREAYYANAELRNSDDPDAYGKWAAEWKQNFDKGILEDGQGNPQFSALEVSKSNYHQGLDHSVKGLQSEHLSHRVAERGRIGEENAGNLATTRLDSDLGVGEKLLPKEKRDYAQYARDMVDSYYNSITGAVANGMDKSKANRAMSDVILTKAISEKDEEILRIASHIKTPGGDLAGTAYFKEKADQATLQIAGSKYTTMLREYEASKMKAIGTPAEVAAQYKKNYDRTNSESDKKDWVNAQTNLVLSFGLTNLSPQALQKQSEAMAEFKRINPEEAMKVQLTMIQAKDSLHTAASKTPYLINTMDLFNLVGKAPGTQATNAAIDQMLRDDRISGTEWKYLREKSEVMGQAKAKYAHLLDDKLYTNLEESVHKGVAKNLAAISGVESVTAGEAAFRFRLEAISVIQKTPGITPTELAIVMQPRIKDIVSDYNETAKYEFAQIEEHQKGMKAVQDMALHMSKPEVQKQQAEQIKKAEVQSAEIKQKDAKGIPVVAEKPAATFSPKNEERFQKWLKANPSKLSEAELRKMFKEGKTPSN